MAADRERVLGSGMNDHITKPLDLTRMFTIMARWITPSQPAVSPDQALAPPAAALQLGSLDTQDGLARCMGNMDLYRRLLKGFARTQRDFARQLEATNDDPEQALALVHSLKGLAGNIGARQLLESAALLETRLHALQQAQRSDTPGSADALVDPVRESVIDTLTRLDTVLAEIDRIGRQGESASTASSPAAGEHASIAHIDWEPLARLVADQDAHARDTLQEMVSGRAALRQHPQVIALKRALERYDFDEGARLLSALSTQARSATVPRSSE